MLTAERVRQLLSYDPATGEFTWLSRQESDHFVVSWNKKFAGKPAGRKPRVGKYHEIAIDSNLYYSHRLAWLYMTGEWPKEQIDHIDLNKANNRFANLREATCADNAHNLPPKKNKYGKGVCFNKPSKKFHAMIRVNNKTISLGYFYKAKEAAAAYVDAALKYHGEFASF